MSAWAASGLRRLLVVSEDEGNPAVKVFKLLSSLLFPAQKATRGDAPPPGARREVEVRTGRTLEDDMRTLMCARSLVLSYSHLNTILLTSSRLRRVYTHAWPDDEIWTGSCHAHLLVASVSDGDALRVGGAGEWAASPEQLLALVTARHDERVRFVRARARCLNITGPAVLT